MNRVFRRFGRMLCALCCLALALLPTAPATAADVFRVGYISVPGFFTQDENGRCHGYGYEYLESLAAYADCSFTYVDLGLEREAAALDRGEVDLVIGTTLAGDPRYLYSEHSIGRTPLQISLAPGADSAKSPLRIGYFAPVFEPSALDDALARFFPQGRYTLVPMESRADIRQGLSHGTLQGVTNDGLHPEAGSTPAGNLRMIPHYILYRQDESALKARLDAAANDLLTVMPNLAYVLMSRQEQHGAPLLLTQEEKAWLADHPHITAFASPKQPPYAYFDAGGHKGVTQDITDQMERDLGITFDILPSEDNEEMLSRFDAGEADVLLDFYYDFNWAHEHHASITNPYLTVNYVLIHRRDKDVPSAPVIAAPRSRNFTHEYVERTYPARDIRYYDTDEDCLRAVEEGHADVCAVKSITAQALIYKNGFFLLEAENAIVFTQGTSIAVSAHVDPIFVRILNKEIAHLDPTIIQSVVNEETRAMTEQAPVTSILYRYPAQSLLVLTLVFLVIVAALLFFFRTRRSHLAVVARLAYTEPVTGLKNDRWLEKQLPAAIARYEKERAAGRLYLVAICVRQLEYYRATYTRELLAKSFVDEIHRASAAYPWFDLYAIAGDRGRIFVLWVLPQGLTPQAAAAQIEKDAATVPFGEVMTRIRYHVSALRIPREGPVGDIPQLLTTVSASLMTALAQNQPFVLFNDAMKERLTWTSRIEAAAPIALAEQQFEVWYQPKYDLRTRALVGAEALVRWQSPELGFLPPGRFIGIFEKNGFAVRLDYYMLGHVARFLEARLRKGLPVVPVSVNQSALHISEGGYLQKMKEAAAAYQLPHGLIDLEITETAFVDFKTKEARDNSRHIVGALKSYGFATSMDDFCTGYSSTAMLQNLPMDTMKIDRSILLAAERDDRSARIIQNVIRLGNDLGMNILCEGIETEAQEELLKKLGCTYGQGYFYARPMSQQDFEAFMETHLA